MKTTLLLSVFICSLLCLSCLVKTSEKHIKKEEIALEKRVLDSLRFNIKKFEINAYKQKLFKENFKKPGYDAQYEEELKDGIDIRQWTVFTYDEEAETQEYTEEISKKWKPFVINKVYDYKGILKAWVETFRSEPINKSYEYDESGKVIKITNYEERYKHSFADIREFLLKTKGIDIYDTRQAIARRVNHISTKNSEAYYDISILNKKVTEVDYRIVIFDETLELKIYN